MGYTIFTPKISGEKFFASEYMQFVESINNIEKAINITPGTNNAQIPSSNLAGGIPGSKIDPDTQISISALNVSGETFFNGPIYLDEDASLLTENGISFTPRQVIISDGSRTTLKVDEDGKVSIAGHINADDSSILRGEMHIHHGNVSGLLSVGGLTGILIDGGSGSISVGSGGSISAGGTTLSSSGLHMRSGDISINDESGNPAFSVSSLGSLFAKNVDISGKISASSGSIGGISISSIGISSPSFSIMSSGRIEASDVHLTGVINATSGKLGDMQIEGELSGPGYSLTQTGLEITKGSINLGNGALRIYNTGRIEASDVNLSGHINATSGNVSGTFTAGSVILSEEGVRVSGEKGLVVDSGSIEVWTDTENPYKVLTLGKYLDSGSDEYGILVEDEYGKTFSVTKSGDVFVKGIIDSSSGSQITGHITAETGEFFDVDIKGSIKVRPGGTIEAGESIISDSGIEIKSGSIQLGQNFEVDDLGNLSAVNASLRGHIEADSGKIIGFLSVGEGEDRVILDGENGVIRAGESRISPFGITIKNGSIDLGGGSFSVDSDGNMVAESASIRGFIDIEGAFVRGDVLAGGVVIQQDGIKVRGNQGIQIKNGSLSVLDADDNEIIRLGSYEGVDGLSEYGMLVRSKDDIEETFRIDSDGNVTMSGTVYAKDGSFSGHIDATSGSFGNIDIIGAIKVAQGGKIYSENNFNIDSSGIKIYRGEISLGGSMENPQFNVNDNGKLIAKDVEVEGDIRARLGWFGSEEGVLVGPDGIEIKQGRFIMKNGLENFLTLGSFINNIGQQDLGMKVVDEEDRITVQISKTGNAFFRGTVQAYEGTIAGDGVIEINPMQGITIHGGSVVLTRPAGGSFEPFLSLGVYTSGEDVKRGILSLDEDGQKVFELDSTGELFVKGRVEADSGYFHGEIMADSGYFKGQIESSSGFFGTESNRINITSSGVNMGTGTLVAGPVSLSNIGIVGPEFSLNSHGITANSGYIGSIQITENGLNVVGLSKITAGDTEISSSGIFMGSGSSIDINGKFVVNSSGMLTAEEADISGTISANAGRISNIYIDEQGIYTGDRGESSGFSINNDGSIVASDVDLSGRINATSGTIAGISFSDSDQFEYKGIYKNFNIGSGTFNEESGPGFYIGADGTFMAKDVSLSGEIAATSGSIGGITIHNGYIESLGFSVNKSRPGHLVANDVDLTGEIKATSGFFGIGQSRVSITNEGIFTGSAIGDASSTFWISSSTGDAFFSGQVNVTQGSLIDGGDLVVNQGSIIAGSQTGAHVRVAYFPTPTQINAVTFEGPLIYGSNDYGEAIFQVTRKGAYFKGQLEASAGNIAGMLTVGREGESGKYGIYIDGGIEVVEKEIDGKLVQQEVSLRPPGIFLNNSHEDSSRVIRLNHLGLYISEDGGQTFSPALTAKGLDATVINDGYITISDQQGTGSSGIIIKKWNQSVGQNGELVDRVIIDPDGITVYDGAINVYSEETGQVLIGGGYLRVDGLDMGVVTSNNYVGNGNFSMISTEYGIKQKTAGEVFMGQAQSHGGAVSNPTYHYVGWPDHPERGFHDVWTYKLDENGLAPIFDIDDEEDPNRPNMTWTSFNPQWVAVCPCPTKPFAVIPNDACNTFTVVDKDGNLVVNLIAWKEGLFGASFTPDGNRLVLVGDDIDRRRTPSNCVVFDTTNIDPRKWERIGIIPTGELPSKVVCDDNGFAYVTVSTDNSLFKLDIVNMKVDKVLSFPRATVPQPIAISPDYTKLYVGGVVTDLVYVVPTDFNTPLEECETWHGAPPNILTPDPDDRFRGMIHDLFLSQDGKYLAVANASILDGSVSLIDTDTGEIVDFIQSFKHEQLAWYKDGLELTEEEMEEWNFKSTTSLAMHPTLPIIYATVTNRCEISIIDYSDIVENGELGKLYELRRVQAGSNPSGVRVSVDGTRLYVSNHHYHTYPLGANRVWSYDGETNLYARENPEQFDTSQKFYHFNPSGLALTHNDTMLWVANRATNSIRIINTIDRDTWLGSFEEIKDVGSKPYALKANPSRTKMIVTNDDSVNKLDPDYITIIDVESKNIDGKIYVGDRPMGIEIGDVEGKEFVYIACSDGNMIQKASLETRRIVASAEIEGFPRFLKIVGNSLFATFQKSNKLYELDLNLNVLNSWDCEKEPGQMAYVSSSEKLYVVCQASDVIRVFDVDEHKFIKEIEVGSMPVPIASSKVPVDGSLKDRVYVGNAGEGSCCIIDPEIDEVVEWVMTGHSAEYITIAKPENGSRWYVSAHGPRDILSYGDDKPFFGDAYLDSSGQTHRYGAEYWYPQRSPWHRALDNTLNSYSTVEFKPNEVLHDKLGYVQMSVLGVYDVFSQIEQDVYTLENASDGASNIHIETIVIPNSGNRELSEDIADFRELYPTGIGAPLVNKFKNVYVKAAGENGMEYVEGLDYVINYTNNTISKPVFGSRIPDTVSQRDVSINEDNPPDLISNYMDYNSIIVRPAGETMREFKEGEDYVIEDGKIVRLEMGSIEKGQLVDIHYSQAVMVRYYYHPYKRNYKDTVLSADFFWRWPRPENQHVLMEIDEMVPKFVIADSGQTDPWTPVVDNIHEEYRGLTYSSYSDRMKTAVVSASAEPLEGSLSDISTKAGGGVKLPEGEQSIEIDLGAIFYINEIKVKHFHPDHSDKTVNDVKVEVWDGQGDWKVLYEEETSPSEYIVERHRLYINKDGLEENLRVATEIRYIRIHFNGNSVDDFNYIYSVEVMGDWKKVTSYMFARDTLWDSEGRRENYMVITDEFTRFDGEEIDGPVRFRTFYTSPDGSTTPASGGIDVYSIEGEVYSKDTDYEWVSYNNTIRRRPGGRIGDNEVVRVVYRFVQEDLSHLTVPGARRDPITGRREARGAVAESNVTGAFIEWEFENEFRCDWSLGWVSDIGLGAVNVYMDDELVYSIDQDNTVTERFSQVAPDLKPGKHKFKLVQRYGKVNIDRIKVEDYQVYYTNTHVVADPFLNPVELFSWYTDKKSPGAARKYLGRGSQIFSGTYDNPRTDNETRLPNHEVPIKYRIRFKTELRGRGDPSQNPDIGSGGELGDRANRFERGTILITNVNFEEGVNPTYWRMSPSSDKHPGFSIESWNPLKPKSTGIQNHHIANASIDRDKIKTFSIIDAHISNNAKIQESKLDLNFPTHGHSNMAFLNQLTGFGDGANDVARGNHTHNYLSSSGGTVSGELSVEGNLVVGGTIKQANKYEVVHRRPLYGLAGDLQLETGSSSWIDVTKLQKNLFGYAMPPVQEGATRYYRLYAVYGDNISSEDSVRARMRIATSGTPTNVLHEWTLPETGANHKDLRDCYSEYFSIPSLESSDHKIQIRIQNSSGTYSGEDKRIELEWLELVAYDVFES